MTRAMTKWAPSWRKAAMTATVVVGIAGGGRAQAFAPAQPVAPPAQQPGYPPAPAQPAPSAAPAQSPGPDAPPQYPPQPAPAYPQGNAPQPNGPPVGYPQQPYPPAGYPQQYPPQQQGYPAQYPPPPGYPQQQYEQPGYPPGYYPPPGYPAAQPPAPPPSTRPHGHGGLLLLPYLGIQANEGATGQDQGVGGRLGGLIGYRTLGGQASFNAELTIDVLNLKNAPTGVDVTGAGVDLAFSPLFHFDAGPLELAVGPKLGIGVTAVQAKDDTGTLENSTTGFTYGANLGAFVPLGNGASLGGLISFQVRTVSQVCSKNYSGTETCVDASNANVNSDKILGITGAALF